MLKICRPVIILRYFSSNVDPLPLRKLRRKSISREPMRHMVDVKQIRAVGGKGGDGCISFLRLWANDTAGPDGGDGGSGGHVILKATTGMNNLDTVGTIVKGADGEKGYNKGCNGKNADHTLISVPVGTVIRNNNIVVGDLDKEGCMFILARGGAGGRGNSFFKSDTRQSPMIAEFGATGEELAYVLELKSMANFGLVGFPNAGKSTILQAISRARPKVASYPFTTLKPYMGVVEYSDYERITVWRECQKHTFFVKSQVRQISPCPSPHGFIPNCRVLKMEPKVPKEVADLPGLIEDSHKGRGLGIQFLRHAERCTCLAIVVDTTNEPLAAVYSLQRELELFSERLAKKNQIIIANKMDLPDAEENLIQLKEELGEENVIPISAKFGTNVTDLLMKLRKIYDTSIINKDSSEGGET